MRDGRRRFLDDGSSCAASAASVRAVGAAVHDDRESSLGDQRRDVHLDVEGDDAHLGEPEAVLLDEIEAEDVAAGRARRVERHLERDRLAGATGRGNGVRGPSQTIALPWVSSQW